MCKTTGTCCLDLARYFDASPRPGGFASLVDNPAGCFRCEAESVSARSKQIPVGNSETLIRIVVAPKDRHKYNPSLPSERCFSTASNSGLSVLRAGINNDVALEIETLARYLVHTSAMNISDEEVAECLGVIEFQCSLPKAMPCPIYILRSFGVYETPQDNEPSHADVLQAVNLYSSKRKANLDVLNLFEKVRSTFIPAEQYKRANLRGIYEVGNIVR